MIRTAAAALALLLATSALAQAPSPAVSAAVADAARPAADKERDANRKPGQTVAFAGVKAGDKVAELMPGGGYYTRILAKTVGPNGKVYALVPAAMASRPGALDALNAIAQANPNVQVITGDFAAMKLSEPVDVVWTSENYHDFSNAPAGIAALNKNVLAMLKPGGTFFVEDHNAKAGSAPDVTQKLHRIDVARVKQELQAAGFRLEAEADHLKNPADPGDIPAGDPSVRGKTDKFALKLRKPA